MLSLWRQWPWRDPCNRAHYWRRSQIPATARPALECTCSPPGADPKALRTIGANKHLVSGQPERSALHLRARARNEWIVAVRPFLQSRNDQRRAAHHRLEHGMRRSGEGSRRDGSRPDRLTHKPKASLLKQQGKLGKPETKAALRGGNQDAEPAEVAGGAQTCRRKGRILAAKSARHFRSRRR